MLLLTEEEENISLQASTKVDKLLEISSGSILPKMEQMAFNACDILPVWIFACAFSQTTLATAVSTAFISSSKISTRNDKKLETTEYFSESRIMLLLSLTTYHLYIQISHEL